MYCPMNCPNCSELQTQSEIIWKDSKDAINFGYPLYEETISQTTSLRINRSLNSRTGIIKAPNESKNGADWLWLVYDRFTGTYLKFAVQAKRLGVDSLYGATKIKQISDIRRFAKKNGFIPIYVFFNHDWDGFIPRNFLTPFIFQGVPAALGATYLHADYFAHLSRGYTAKQNLNQKDKKAISDLIKRNSKPWFQLLCRCNGSQTTSIIESISQRVQNFDLGSDLEEFQNDIDPRETDSFLKIWFDGNPINEADLWGFLGLNDWESDSFNPDFAMRFDVGKREADDQH